MPWPTISATVGHLEARWNWVALIVVGLIVFGAFHAAQVVLPSGGGGQPLPRRGRSIDQRPRTETGRLVVAPRRQPDQTARPISTRWLLIGGAVAVAILVVGVLVAVQRPHTTRFLVGYVLHGLIAAFWIILASLLAGLFRRDVPFLGLFQTIARLDAESKAVGHLVVLVILVGLAVLLIHLALYPWPANIEELQNLHQVPTPASP